MQLKLKVYGFLPIRDVADGVIPFGPLAATVHSTSVDDSVTSPFPSIVAVPLLGTKTYVFAELKLETLNLEVVLYVIDGFAGINPAPADDVATLELLST